MIDLYYFYPACSLAAHIALEESGLAFTAHRLNLKDPTAAAAYRKINPQGTVPIIIDGGVLLSENVAIMAYIDALAPKAKLLPADPMARAQCLSFLVWGASTAHINFRMSFRPERFGAPESLHDAMKTLGRENFWKNLQELDVRMQGRTWYMGDDYSAADGYLLRLYDWGRVAKYPIEELKALRAFQDRMIARPAVRRVLAREESPLVASAA